MEEKTPIKGEARGLANKIYVGVMALSFLWLLSGWRASKPPEPSHPAPAPMMEKEIEKEPTPGEILDRLIVAQEHLDAAKDEVARLKKQLRKKREAYVRCFPTACVSSCEDDDDDGLRDTTVIKISQFEPPQTPAQKILERMRSSRGEEVQKSTFEVEEFIHPWPGVPWRRSIVKRMSSTPLGSWPPPAPVRTNPCPHGWERSCPRGCTIRRY